MAARGVRPSPLGAPRGLGHTPEEVAVRTLGAAKEIQFSDPAEFSLKAVGVSQDEADEARGAPQTIGVSPIMPTALVVPTARGEPTEDRGRSTWGVIETRAEASIYDGQGVTVAVLDTGIDRDHVAFEGLQIEECDFSGEGNGDGNGHGTHVAATIFGRSVDGKRIGIAPNVSRALIGKILRADGTGDTGMMHRAMEWAINSNADVISMSIGFDFPGLVKQRVGEGWPADLATSDALVTYRDNLRLLDSFMSYVRRLAPFQRGAVLVAAAGNESKVDAPKPYRIAVSLPAAAEGFLSVGALKRDGDMLSVAAFSNSMPRLCAPGVDILSAARGTHNGLVAMSGTSMACPHVSGAAALWWQALRAEEPAPAALKVEQRILGGLRIDVFKSDVVPLDRGDGLVTAP